VKTCFLPHIRADWLVTRHAQTILGFAVELDVTLLAVVFDLGVPLNEFSRCHDGFKTLSLCNWHTHEEEQGKARKPVPCDL